MIPGWSLSKGSLNERKEAQNAGLMVFYYRYPDYSGMMSPAEVLQ